MFLLFITLTLSFYGFRADALDCYSCSNLRNLTDCHQVVVCSADEHCFTETTGTGAQTRFTLGCRSKEKCLTPQTTTYSPLSIIGRAISQYVDCSQCCAKDACNKNLCTYGTQAISAGRCVDDPSYNCAQISTIFNICSDIHHAKRVCREFCGLCDVIDGNWSPWESWSRCDVTCGKGIISRQRRCDNPAPKNHGLPCIGPLRDTAQCVLKDCPIHGGWTEWNSWGSCSTSCGIGLQRRDRNCTNPSPGPDGIQCPGDSRDDRACFLKACADGQWSHWSSWTICSATCLGGISIRRRLCNSPMPSLFGHDCVGNDEEHKLCNTVPCPDKLSTGYWSSWSSWRTCSATCGFGIRTRNRTCTKLISHLPCTGNSIDYTLCNIMKCAGYEMSLVRLVNGQSKYEGRLEVYDRGAWQTVCDDSFNDNTAKVVCRMLGLPIENAKSYQRAHFGAGTGGIALDDIHCSGSEPSIFDCAHNSWYDNNCDHSEDVGLSCFPSLKVRLVGGNNYHSGRVEVSLDGSNWGTVCDDVFDRNNNSARVVCRMLGYPYGNAKYDSNGIPGSGPIYLDDVNCVGSEHSLLDCSHRPWGEENCSHSEDAAVICA